MVVFMMGACMGVCYYMKWGRLIPFNIKKIGKAALRAYLGFIAIAIIMFGIYSGTFSPTEAAGITAGFCLLAGLFVTREIKVTSCRQSSCAQARSRDFWLL